MLFQWSVNYAFFRQQENWEVSIFEGILVFILVFWQKIHLQLLTTLLNFFFWSVNYANLVYNLFINFENVKIHKHCLYWKVFNSNIYRKIYFNSLLVFSYICWSVNCMSWVSKLNNFFWYAGKLRLDLYLRALILPFMESSFLTLQYFFCFFYLVCKLFKGLFQPLCQSVNFISWVFES